MTGKISRNKWKRQERVAAREGAKFAWPIRRPRLREAAADDTPRFIVKDYIVVETLLVFQLAGHHHQITSITINDDRDQIDPLDYWDEIAERVWVGDRLFYLDKRRRLLAVSEFQIFKDYLIARAYLRHHRQLLDRSEFAYKRSLSVICGDLSKGCDSATFQTLLENAELIETSKTTHYENYPKKRRRRAMERKAERREEASPDLPSRATPQNFTAPRRRKEAAAAIRKKAMERKAPLRSKLAAASPSADRMGDPSSPATPKRPPRKDIGKRRSTPESQRAPRNVPEEE